MYLLLVVHQTTRTNQCPKMYLLLYTLKYVLIQMFFFYI